MRCLEKLAQGCAILAGTLLTLITLITCASVVGRNLMAASLVGDFELTGVTCGLAVALFMPWCQLSKGHIIVDFFTSGNSAKTNDLLDRIGAMLMAAAMALLAWRTALGGINAWDNHSGSMLLAIPDWLVYAGMVPPLALTGVIALWQAVGQTASAPSNTADGVPL